MVGIPTLTGRANRKIKPKLMVWRKPRFQEIGDKKSYNIKELNILFSAFRPSREGVIINRREFWT
jgi:hypothetical protein